MQKYHLGPFVVVGHCTVVDSGASGGIFPPNCVHALLMSQVSVCVGCFSFLSSKVLFLFLLDFLEEYSRGNFTTQPATQQSLTIWQILSFLNAIAPSPFQTLAIREFRTFPPIADCKVIT